MVKARTIYVFKGPGVFSFFRGYPPQGNHKQTIKHKLPGIIGSRWTFARNIDDVWLSKPCQWFDGNKIREGWQVIEVGFDYVNGKAYVPEVSPRLMSEIENLRNQLMSMTNLYYEEKKKNMTRTMKDKTMEETNKMFKQWGDVKDKIFSGTGQGMGMNYPYYGRGGYTPISTYKSEDSD